MDSVICPIKKLNIIRMFLIIHNSLYNKDQLRISSYRKMTNGQIIPYPIGLSYLIMISIAQSWQ